MTVFAVLSFMFTTFSKVFLSFRTWEPGRLMINTRLGGLVGLQKDVDYDSGRVRITLTAPLTRPRLILRASDDGRVAYSVGPIHRGWWGWC